MHKLIEVCNIYIFLELSNIYIVIDI